MRKLNLNISEQTFTTLVDLDKTFVGTKHYMGLAPFWGQALESKFQEVQRSNSFGFAEVDHQSNLKLIHDLAFVMGIDIQTENPDLLKIINAVLNQELENDYYLVMDEMHRLLDDNREFYKKYPSEKERRIIYLKHFLLDYELDYSNVNYSKDGKTVDC